ncbi:MAG TPA: DMT family protein [Steroidobacteraceae bacterium]|jgi:uncharacterized protein (DUF486 family)|nr:DMT family protein [Steroidobacteraceae bacterium]HNS27981.1 DMT family protein [Steroidobacteraceae bacterium]
MPAILPATGLLILSNAFMTFAWYAHLKNFSTRPWFIAALVSWGIAFFEYMLQEVIALAVFVPFAVLYMREPLKLDYLWASLCILGAVYFMFRS